MRYTGGEALVEVLKEQGVKAIFSSPGTEWTPVWEALAKFQKEGRAKPEYFNCRHEMLAVSAAMGYAQRGEELPAVLLHTSAGLLHGAMAIHKAYMDQVPMLVISGDSDLFTEDRNPKSAGGWQWMTRSDVGGSSPLARPYVKWSQTITSRETLSGTVARACQLARMAPRGPVYLSLSHEYMQEELEETMPRFAAPQTPVTPDAAVMEKIAGVLLAGRKPMIITERVGAQPRAVAKLVELAEFLSIPVFEAMRQYYINFPKDHPLHAGFDVADAIREADVVLALAATTPWNPQRMNPRPEAKILFIDDQAPYSRLPYWNFRSDITLAVDPLTALEALVESVQAKRAGIPAGAERRQCWHEKHDQLFDAWKQQAKNSRSKNPIDCRWLCHCINECLPADAAVVLETVSHTGTIIRTITNMKPGNFFKADVGGLGCGMGMALGLKMVTPGQPVLHLIGDGSFNYAPVLSALGFAQEYGVPVLTVIFNNGAYRAMQSAHLRLYPDGCAAQTKNFYGVDITPNPDYNQLMKVFDGYGEKVADPEEIPAALGRAWAEIKKGRSALLDVILDPGDPR